MTKIGKVPLSPSTLHYLSSPVHAFCMDKVSLDFSDHSMMHRRPGFNCKCPNCEFIARS